MARQPSTTIENSFIKGLITSSSGMSFPENAVTSASNCVFDYLGTASRREGFDFEVGSTPKTVNYQGQAISSYLWHNVTGDNTTNIYVVQVGGKLYFYPVTIAGSAISPQISTSLPLDFSGLSSQAINSTLIDRTAGSIISGSTTGFPLQRASASFDGTTISASSVCTSDNIVNGVANTATAGQVFRTFVGKDFGVAPSPNPNGLGPRRIGTATITAPTDVPLGSSNVTYQNSQRTITYTYQFVSQTATLTANIPSPQDLTGWLAIGNTTGASGGVASQTFTGSVPNGRGGFSYNYSYQLTMSSQTAFSAGENLTFQLGATTFTGGTETSYTVGTVTTTLNQTADSTAVTSATAVQATTVQVNLRAASLTAAQILATPITANDSRSILLGSITGAGTITPSTANQAASFQQVWFEVATVTNSFAGFAPTDTGAITTGGAYTDKAVGAVVFRVTQTFTILSYAEATTIAEVQFFSPTTSIGSPFVNNFECQYANGLGFLFVTHPWCYPFVVQYTAGSPPTYSATPIVIQCRDFDGVDDGLQLATGAGTNIATRPAPAYTIASSTTSPNPLYNSAKYDQLHLYNLQNQGWSAALINTWLANNPAGTAGQGGTGVNSPSNCDVWWYLLSSSNPPVFTPANISIVDVGSTAAPKGSFIFDAFYIDRGALVQPTSQITVGASILGVAHSNLNRPSTVAFFAGRAWYSGVNYPNFSNCIWFSQILSPTSSTVIPSLGQCYQSNDPTSSKTFDLLPTDGGTIRIPDCGTIIKLFPMQGALLVFATNGIWVISGSKGGLGFTANDYSINRLSTMNCLSGQSIVDVQGQPMFWTNEGIYTIRTNLQSGGMQIQSLTYPTIDQFYKAIPRNSKVYARGAYNPFDFTVQWLYRSTAPTTLPDDNYKFDSVLVFNTLTGGFSPFTVSTGNVNLASIVCVETGLETDVSPTQTTYTFKYFVTYSDTLGNLRVNIADMFSTRYLDWYSYDSVGQNYTSTFTSGYKFVGQGVRRGISDYIYFYVKNSPTPNSYKVQSIRDYGLDKTSGKWSSINLFTNSSSHFTNFIRRHRLRGRGLIMQYKVTSYQNDPFDILGWAVWSTAGTSP